MAKYKITELEGEFETIRISDKDYEINSKGLYHDGNLVLECKEIIGVQNIFGKTFYEFKLNNNNCILTTEKFEKVFECRKVDNPIKVFGKDYLKVKLLNGNRALVNESYKIVCEYKQILGMEMLFGEKCLLVESEDDKEYLDENFDSIFKFDRLKYIGDNYIKYTLNNKLFMIEKNE